MKKLLLFILLLSSITSFSQAISQHTRLWGFCEYMGESIRCSDSSWWTVGNDPSLKGQNGVGTQGVPYKVTLNDPTDRFVSLGGGLHDGAVVDANGYVHFVGSNFQGEYGSGNTIASSTEYKLLKDSAGNPFNNIVQVHGGWQAVQAAPFYVAVKGDGTVWIWGYTGNGGEGNASNGQALQKPVQVHLTGGKLAKRVAVNDHVMILCTDGTVQTFANDFAYAANLGRSGSNRIPTDVGLLHIRAIAAGYGFNYAIDSSNNLHFFGQYGLYGGYGISGTIGTQATPLDITSHFTTLLTNLGGTYIDTIVCNHNATMALLHNHKAITWGGIPTGSTGTGNDFFWVNYTTGGTTPYNGSTPQPYAWNFEYYLATDQNDYVIQPTQVTPGKLYDAIFGGILFNFDFGMEGLYGDLFMMGRNKGAVIPDHVIAPDTTKGQIESSYHESYNRIFPVLIDSFGGNFTTHYVTSPWCILGTNASTAPCNNYTIPIIGPPHAVVTSGTTGIGNYVLDARSSTYDFLNSGIWYQVDGPVTVALAINTSPTDSTVFTQTGTYHFKYVVKNSIWKADSAIATIVVTSAVPPTVSAGLNQNVVPSSVTLTGTASGNNGATISSTLWTQISGPTTGVIVSPSSLTTPITNLAVGTYVFQLSATDSNSNTTTSQVTVTVVVNGSFILWNRGLNRYFK